MNFNEMIDEAIRALDTIDARDPEIAHSQADDILLHLVPMEVRHAYERLIGRCKWWECA